MFLHVHHCSKNWDCIFHFSVIINKKKNILFSWNFRMQLHSQWKNLLKYNNASLQQNSNKNKLCKPLFCHVSRCLRTNLHSSTMLNFIFPFWLRMDFESPETHLRRHELLIKETVLSLSVLSPLESHNCNVPQLQLKSHLHLKSRNFTSCLFRRRFTLKTQNISWQHDQMSVLCTLMKSKVIWVHSTTVCGDFCPGESHQTHDIFCLLKTQRMMALWTHAETTNERHTED